MPTTPPAHTPFMAGGGAVHYGRVPGRPVPSPLANERISACQPAAAASVAAAACNDPRVDLARLYGSTVLCTRTAALV
jgi:hypothetical protein